MRRVSLGFQQIYRCCGKRAEEQMGLVISPCTSRRKLNEHPHTAAKMKVIRQGPQDALPSCPSVAVTCDVNLRIPEGIFFHSFIQKKNPTSLLRAKEMKAAPQEHCILVHSPMSDLPQGVGEWLRVGWRKWAQPKQRSSTTKKQVLRTQKELKF